MTDDERAYDGKMLRLVSGISDKPGYFLIGDNKADLRDRADLRGWIRLRWKRAGDKLVAPGLKDVEATGV